MKYSFSYQNWRSEISKSIKEWSLKECSNHYDVDEDFDDYTNIVCVPGETPVDELSKKYKVSKERIRQIEEKSLNILKDSILLA